MLAGWRADLSGQLLALKPLAIGRPLAGCQPPSCAPGRGLRFQAQPDWAPPLIGVGIVVVNLRAAV